MLWSTPLSDRADLQGSGGAESGPPPLRCRTEGYGRQPTPPRAVPTLPRPQPHPPRPPPASMRRRRLSSEPPLLPRRRPASSQLPTAGGRVCEPLSVRVSPSKAAPLPSLTLSRPRSFLPVGWPSARRPLAALPLPAELGWAVRWRRPVAHPPPHPPPPMASFFNPARRRYSRSHLLRDWRWAFPRPHATKAEFFSPPPRRRRYTVKDPATANGEALAGPAVSAIGAVAAVMLDLGMAASPQLLCGSAPLRHPAGRHF